MQDIFKDLNKRQAEAVRTVDGPILMLAGAGSGKTKTLTHRIAYLLSEMKVSPLNILAVTFTNKAAGEMRSRVHKILNLPEAQHQYLPFLGTFHSIAVRILRREASLIGYPTSFIIYDDADSKALIKTIYRELRIDEKIYAVASIKNLISSAKNELLDHSKYAQLASGKMQEMAARIYPIYQDKLRRTGAMDFDDLIMQLVIILNENEDILKKYREQFRYVMVDEYQDTNHAQYKMIRLIADGHRNICVVGDDWQSIYSWRGANYQNILNFERHYPDAKVVRLEQNYRSTQTILDAAHQVITKNINRSDKKLWTEAGLGAKIVIEQLQSGDDEGRFVIQTVDRLRSANQSLALSDFAILYRTNAQSRGLEEAFLRYGIPYQIIGGVRFYERREIKDSLAFLRFIFQPQDLVSLNRIINLPPRGLGDKSMQVFIDYVGQTGLNPLVAAASAEEIQGLSPRAKNSLSQFASLIDGLREACDKMVLSDFIELVLKKTGYLDWIDDGSLTSADRIENIKEFIGVAKTYDNLGLEGFLTEISLIADIDNYADSNDAVVLMTLHAAKGLEFDTVFMVGMEESIFPHSRSFFEASELEEERRLCYVGMTRARARLYMLSAASRIIYGGIQHNAPSRFLTDIPSQLTTTQSGWIESNTASDKLEKELSAQPGIEVKPGDRVFHPNFGEGEVISFDEFEVKVNFDNQGTKILNVHYAPLSKTKSQ